jgi:hypothetical protein
MCQEKEVDFFPVFSGQWNGKGLREGLGAGMAKMV